MFRYRKCLPESNRLIMRATRERAYARHLNALDSAKSALQTRRAKSNTVGKDFQTSGDEKDAITNKHRNRSAAETERKFEGLTSLSSRRHHAVHGFTQKEEIRRINIENQKILKAIRNQKTDYDIHNLQHIIDHEYQVCRISEYRSKVPYNDIVKEELRKNGYEIEKKPNENLDFDQGCVPTNSQKKYDFSFLDPKLPAILLKPKGSPQEHALKKETKNNSLKSKDFEEIKKEKSFEAVPLGIEESLIYTMCKIGYFENKNEVQKEESTDKLDVPES